MVIIRESNYDKIKEDIFSKIKMPSFYPTPYQMQEIWKMADDKFMVLMMCYFYDMKMLPEKKSEEQKSCSREVFKFLQENLEITD